MAHKILYVTAICFVTACGRDSAEQRTAAGLADSGPAASGPAADSTTGSDLTPVVLFVGTSLTAGLGLDLEEAYPALIQAKVDSARLKFRVVNAGVSGETSAGALRRIDWLLNQPVAVLVLESGANDALRGQDLAAAERNLQQIVERTRSRHPAVRVVIAGMQAPPNLGQGYTTEFRDLFVRLARNNNAALIPFLLDSVAAIPSLNQADGIHPTAEGHRIMATNVWRTLYPVLKTVRSEG